MSTVEALTLAGLAAVAGVTFALYALDRLKVVMALEFGGRPFWSTAGRDPATVVYAVGLAVLAAVVAGVLPGLKATGKGAQASVGSLIVVIVLVFRRILVGDLAEHQ
jgi:hypothetical protein